MFSYCCAISLWPSRHLSRLPSADSTENRDFFFLVLQRLQSKIDARIGTFRSELCCEHRTETIWFQIMFNISTEMCLYLRAHAIRTQVLHGMSESQTAHRNKPMHVPSHNKNKKSSEKISRNPVAAPFSPCLWPLLPNCAAHSMRDVDAVIGSIGLESITRRRGHVCVCV